MSAARHLRMAPSPEDVLRLEIAEVCAQIDLRLGNPPGTAARGIYFWFWPPGSVTSPTVLTRLHADAVVLLFDIVTGLRR